MSTIIPRQEFIVYIKFRVGDFMKILDVKGKLTEKKRGFTLIELMVVLAVIAVIVYIAVPNFVSIKESVNVKVDKQSCETIKSIARTFAIDGSIKIANDTTPIKFVYMPNKSVGVSGTIDESKIKGGTIPGDKDLLEALSEVRPPQVDNSKGYSVEITKKGKVTVKVDGFDKTSTDYVIAGN